MAVTKKAKAPRRKPQDGTLFLRVPIELIEILDAWVEELRAARPGMNVTRSDLVREALYQAARDRKRTGKGGAR